MRKNIFSANDSGAIYEEVLQQSSMHNHENRVGQANSQHIQNLHENR